MMWLEMPQTSFGVMPIEKPVGELNLLTIELNYEEEFCEPLAPAPLAPFFELLYLLEA